MDQRVAKAHPRRDLCVRQPLFAYFQRLSRARAIKSSRLIERAMGIEPASELWETCSANGQPKLGNYLGTKPQFIGRFLGLNSHKGNRIIRQLAEACGSRTKTTWRVSTELSQSVAPNWE